MKKTKWIHIYKWRPYPNWGVWTDEYIGTEEQFQNMIKQRGIELIGHKKHHYKERLPL